MQFELSMLRLQILLFPSHAIPSYHPYPKNQSYSLGTLIS